MDDVLARVGIFKGISLNGLAALAKRGVTRTFPVGASLMQQGEPSHNFYIIVKGLVKVERHHIDLLEPIVLAELGPGEVVGEMGVLDNAPRAATVIAVEDTTVLELEASDLAVTMLEYPEVASALLHTLSRRLRTTDELAAEMRRREGKQGAESGRQ